MNEAYATAVASRNKRKRGGNKKKRRGDKKLHRLSWNYLNLVVGVPILRLLWAASLRPLVAQPERVEVLELRRLVRDALVRLRPNTVM